MAIEDYDLQAVREACKAFIKNKVAGRNSSFAPSAPELAQECERQQARLRWEAYTAEHVFVIEGSDEWRQMAIARGVSSFPTKEQDGKQGWYLPKHEVQQARLIELPKPVKSPALPNMRKM